MKKIWILLTLLLSIETYTQVYQVRILDKNRSLSKSVVVSTSATPFSLSCTEGELNAEIRTCTVINQITRVEECPSGYTNQGDGTCEGTTTTTPTTSCSRGVDTGSNCRETITRSASTSCPSGYGRFGNDCYRQVSTPVQCPSGFSVADFFNGCINDTDGSLTDYFCPNGLIAGSIYRCYDSAQQASLVTTCPSGFTYNGSRCESVTTYGYDYSCPDSFDLILGECTRTLTALVGLTTCPDGYTEVSSELCEQVMTTPATLTCPSGTSYSVERNSCI